MAVTRRCSRNWRSFRWWREGCNSGMVRKHQTSDAQLRIGESRDSGFDASHRPGMTTKARALLSSLLQIFLHLRAQVVAQIGAGHAERDVGAQEARLRAAIVPLALELDAVEFLRFGELDHAIGELDLAAGAALLRLQDLEDLRLQDVAAGDRKVG